MYAQLALSCSSLPYSTPESAGIHPPLHRQPFGIRHPLHRLDSSSSSLFPPPPTAPSSRLFRRYSLPGAPDRLLFSHRSLHSPKLQKMQRASSSALNRALLATRRYSTLSKSGADGGNLVASVLFERLPVVVPKIDPVVYAFQEFSYRWNQQYSRVYPDEFYKKYEARGKGDYQIDYEPAPRVTEADKTNDKRSLKRALDRRLYLLIYGKPYGSQDDKPVWQFPEKVYENEETLRMCAESALKSVIGDLSHTYFVGNAPMAHLVAQSANETSDIPPLKRFFFKSQVIATNKFDIGKCEDYVWVTKDELIEYFPEQAEFFNQMIIS